uniref:Immunoglobulin superfamily member 6 n=1 Tax=Cairina moschata TaxID=8855 RepID=A0A8C3D0J1_CAIMO
MYHEVKAYAGTIMNSNQCYEIANPHCLFSTGAADKCQVTVRQPRYQKAEYSTQTVSLPCDFSASECSLSKPQVLWFRFFTNKHEDLCTPRCTNDQKFKVQISENSTSLQINDLTVNDSAVYFCGIAFSDSSSPHSKQTGGGTILTKRGHIVIDLNGCQKGNIIRKREAKKQSFSRNTFNRVQGFRTGDSLCQLEPTVLVLYFCSVCLLTKI